MKEFLLSDESVNSHGCIIKTDGIELGRFLANPVMFYNHDESRGVVGKWENVRKSDGKLYATPVFDTDSELGRQVKRQVESGFIRAASIGIDSVEFEYTPTETEPQVVTKCELIEVSICDIPSNRNALQLYYNGDTVDNDTYRRILCARVGSAKQAISAVANALGLPEGATVEDAVGAIRILRDGHPQSCDERIDAAIKCGYVRPDERRILLKSFAGNVAGLSTLLSHRQMAFEKDVEKEYDNFINGKYGTRFDYIKLRAIPQDEMKALMRNNFNTFKRLTGCIERRAMDDIAPQPDNYSGRQNWTLEDYRKNDPMELRRNPGLYRRLLGQQNNI